MTRFRAAIVAFLFLLCTPALAQSTCDPDGVQASGSIYRICMPPAAQYNGNLVIWAHGFQDAGTPVSIPEDQLCLPEGICLNDIANLLGFGFATNSYSKTGLAVVQGLEDIRDLVNIYTAKKGKPAKVYLVGASEGGIITALGLERHPNVFSAGFSMCGPIGSFPMQINYFGDARATFQYFFPGLIPGDPFHPSLSLVAGWSTFYEQSVKPVVMSPQKRSLLNQWVAVAGLPYDAANFEATVEQSVKDVLRYSVVNLADATATLGGFPFDNRTRWYTGSADDFKLNLAVPRVSASPAALAAMAAGYETTGTLTRPMVSMHTKRDQQVPFAHQQIYTVKSFLAGSLFARYLPVEVDRYEHCNFTLDELVWGFFVMLAYDDLVK
ncbi:MAG: alpha/beta hydrolase family protein [Burkholderiales bacterium]